MATTVAEVRTLIDTANAYIDQGDYASAEPVLMKAQTIVAFFPDSSHSQSSIRWSQEAIDRAFTRLRQLKSEAATVAAGTIRHTRFNYLGTRTGM